MNAGLDQPGSGFCGFDDLEHGHARRKNAHLLLGEDTGSALDECGQSASELFQSEDDGIVEDGAGGDLVIGAGGVCGAGAEEQLVGVHLAASIKDGLAGEVVELA